MIRIQGIPVVAKRLQAGQSIASKLARRFRARALWLCTIQPGNAWSGDSPRFDISPSIHVEWLGPAQFLVVVEDAVT
jgi:hypothetical protein